MAKMISVQVPCGKCSNLVTVDLQAAPSMMNTEGLSVAVWEHPKVTLCLFCGTTVVPVIMQVESVKVMAAPTIEQPGRIITGIF